MPVAELFIAAGAFVGAAAQLVSAGVFLVGAIVVGKYVLEKIKLGELVGSKKK